MLELFEEPDGATPLDPDEREGLKLTHITTRAELNEAEQANIEDALLWLSRQRNPKVFTEEFVRQLHIKMLGEVWQWAGTFRTSAKNIGVDWPNISVELRNLLEDAKAWVEHKNPEPSEIAIRFHHRLVKIHVFPNGNGRHSRIMADAILEKTFNAPPIDWGSEELLENGDHRQRYLASLRAADHHDYSMLLGLLRPSK